MYTLVLVYKKEISLSVEQNEIDKTKLYLPYDDSEIMTFVSQLYWALDMKQAVTVSRNINCINKYLNSYKMYFKGRWFSSKSVYTYVTTYFD